MLMLYLESHQLVYFFLDVLFCHSKQCEGDLLQSQFAFCKQKGLVKHLHALQFYKLPS